jgi:hypothetical protein
MTSKKILLLFFAALFILGCSKDDVTPVEEQPGDPKITAFSVGDVQFRIVSDSIIGSTDKIMPTGEVFPVFTAIGKVYADGTELISSVTKQNLDMPRTITVKNSKGVTKDYKVVLTTFTGLPRIYITTDDKQDVTSLDVYKTGTMMIEPNGVENAALPVTKLSIRGRGNSTWGMPKKPYKIKFDVSTSLFGGPTHKEWVLLANYADKTLIRSYMAFTLSAQMQMAFSPVAHFVELFLNGRHDGNYMVTDQVEVSSKRVNVETLSNTVTDPELNKGGYLLEIDLRVRETHADPYFESKDFPIVVKYPKEASEAQMKYIRDYVVEAETALYGAQFKDPANGFRKYFDEESIIKWYIINEVFKSVDAFGYSSIYFYKTRNGKLSFGPVWDFDLSGGNAIQEPICMDPIEFYVVFHKWIWQMYQDPAFKQKIHDVWKQYRAPIFDQLTLIDKTVAKLDKSQKANFLLWPNFSDPNWCVVQGKTTYAAHVAWLKEFMNIRINWFDMAFK